MPLTSDQLDEWRDYERLFGEHGWHRLEKQWRERIDTIRRQALDSVRTEKDLWMQRGWVAILEELAGLRDAMTAQKATLDKEDAERPTETNEYEED